MTRWKCVCAYDGGAFTGWQSQPSKDSVQDVIEARLATIFGADIRVHGSGRTDAGVHALGQVFHFDAEWAHGAEKLAAALGHRLPRQIQIISVRRARPDFHSRISAKRKVYEYRLHLGDADPFTHPYTWVVRDDIDVAAMRRAAAVLKGRHDFRAFSASRGREGEPASTVRRLVRLDVTARGRSVRITAQADGFLYKMVRSLAGALVAVGCGKMSIGELKHCLSSKVRTPSVQTAPAQGLFLRKVGYR